MAVTTSAEVIPSARGYIRLAIQTVLLPGRDLAEQFANAARYGFDGVELNAGPGFDVRAHIGEIQAASAAAGLPVAAICTHPMHDPLHPNPEQQRTRLAALADLLAVADELGAAGVISVPIRPAAAFPGSDPGGDDEDTGPEPVTIDMAYAKDVLGEWVTTLPAGQSQVFLEPLNRFEAKLLNRVGQAVELAHAVDHPRVVALADLFHMNIEESDLGEPLRAAGSLLGHVHIADNLRFEPGTGCLDFATPFAALHEMGYGGWVSLECYGPDGRKLSGPPDDVLPASVAFMRDRWNEADS